MVPNFAPAATEVRFSKKYLSERFSAAFAWLEVAILLERPKAEVSKFIDPDFLVLKKVPFVLCSHEHETDNS